MRRAVVGQGDSRFSSGERCTVQLYPGDSAADSTRVLDRDLVSRRAVAENVLEFPPSSRNAGFEDERSGTPAKSENPLQARTIHPSGRAGVPGPSTAPDVR